MKINLQTKLEKNLMQKRVKLRIRVKKNLGLILFQYNSFKKMNKRMKKMNKEEVKL